MRLNSAKDLEVYKEAYQLATHTFEISKRFPPRRTLRADQPNSAFVPVYLSEPSRGLGQAAL